MSWTLDLKPGEAKDVRFAYRMKWPADREIVDRRRAAGERGALSAAL